MNARHLTLLSPYRLPTDSTLYVGDEEAAAILQGYLALWHPAALAVTVGLPRLGLAHEHEEPAGDQVYVLPENAYLSLADDWADRARAAGAVVVRSTPDRGQTLANLTAALREAGAERHLDLPAEQARPFLGVGFGFVILEALCEAMQHENVLTRDEIFQDLVAAVGASDDPTPHLRSAAERLLAAKEILYPVTIYLVDIFLHDADRAEPSWLTPLRAGQPVNVLASAQLLERLSNEHLAALREKVAADYAEVIGGPYCEREDPLLPLESQLWNLLKGQAVYQERLGRPVRVYARKKAAFHAQLPLLLQSAGLTHAVMVAFDDGILPSHHTAVVSWPSHDGKQVDGFTRAGQPAESAQTYFHLAHYLHQTIMQDQSATLPLVHKGEPTSCFYEDWLALSALAPVLGRRVTLSGYFSEVVAGDYTQPASPDEFHSDYLSDRSGSASATRETAISGFVEQLRQRRKLDAAWTFAAILRSLGGQVPFLDQLTEAEDRFEATGQVAADPHQDAAAALAQRLVARGQPGNAGWLLLNPCSFTRRVAVELTGLTGPIPGGGPVKACQIDGDVARLVVEVPPFGFAWVPRTPAAGTPLSTKLRLADERAVRNEFFEAEIDPQTGGLKTVRDTRQRIGRVGQQLVWNPGSVMEATSVQVTSNGSALGEIVTEGVLRDEKGDQLATFRQRFRAWLGRPLLEVRIELVPTQPIDGYAWHSYFGCRFAWREEAATLYRGSCGMRSHTTQNRPETPDYLELQVGRHNTVLFPGGLPFHQRHGGRMLDVLLVCEGEQGRAFDLGISLDREQPMQTALGLSSPVGLVELDQGPPHVGAAGWLYHLDMNNLLLTSLRPARDHDNAVVATMLECAGAGGPAQFRCARNPVRAVIQDVQGTPLIDAAVQGDAVDFEVSANDLLQLRVEFS